jgi:hypothetical protein
MRQVMGRTIDGLAAPISAMISQARHPAGSHSRHVHPLWMTTSAMVADRVLGLVTVTLGFRCFTPNFRHAVRRADARRFRRASLSIDAR